MTTDHLRHHRPLAHLQGAFGSDWFGHQSEKFARAFGTPAFIITQTIIVFIWIGINIAVVAYRFDPYPFILLNLAFSTQAAYAAPMILLAQTRQADRDKAHAEADAMHREEIAAQQAEALRQNTVLTEEIKRLSENIKNLTEQVYSKVAPEKN